MSLMEYSIPLYFQHMFKVLLLKDGTLDLCYVMVSSWMDDGTFDI